MYSYVFLSIIFTMVTLQIKHTALYLLSFVHNLLIFKVNTVSLVLASPEKKSDIQVLARQ